MLISIITPVHNHAELIPEYEQAVRGADVVLVDNASEPSAARAWRNLAARLGGQYIRNETNAYFSAASNQGYARCLGDLIVFLNNDIRAGAGWLEQLVKQARPGSLWGPAIGMRVVSRQPMIYIEGWCVAGFREDWDFLRMIATPFETGIAPAGPWDEQTYQRPYWDDVDLSFRAARLGLGLKKLFLPIQHLGDTTAATTIGAYAHADTHGGDGTNRKAFLAKVKAWQASGGAQA